MSKTTMFKRLGMGLALAVLSLALVACGGNDDDNKDEPAAKVAVEGGQLSGMINEAVTGGSGIPAYGTAVSIPVKGLENAAAYTAGGESETKFAVKLFPANNNGQLDLTVTPPNKIDVAYTGGNLVISFPADTVLAEVEGVEFTVSAMPKGATKALFTAKLEVVAAADYTVGTVTGFTVADFGVDAANATVQTIVLGAKDAADLNKGYAEGSHSFALTFTDADNGGLQGFKVSRVAGDSFKTEVVKIGEDYAVVISTDQAGKSATYSIAPVAPKAADGDPLPAVFVKVKSVGPVPKVTVADVEITEKDGTANAAITFLPAALTEGTAAYDTTAHDLFAVSSDETIATVTVTNSKVEGTADAIVVEDASGKTAKATVTVYVVPVDATDATNAYSSTTFEVAVTLDPITAVDDAKIAASPGHILLLPLNKGGVALATEDDVIKVLSIEETNKTGTAYAGITAAPDSIGSDYTTANNIALEVATGAAAAKAGDVVTVTLQVVTPGATTADDDVVRSTDTFEVTVIAVPAVTANDVAIDKTAGKTATVTLGLEDYDATAFDILTNVTDPAITAGTPELTASVDEATGVVTLTVGASALTADYTVTVYVVAQGVAIADVAKTGNTISSTTFKVVATDAPLDVTATVEDMDITLTAKVVETADITKVKYVAAKHDLKVAVTAAETSDGTEIVAANYKMVPTVDTDGDVVTLTVDTDTALTVGDVYTVTLDVVLQGGTVVVSSDTFTVTAVADTVEVTAANVNLKLDADSELTLPVVKTAYNAAAHDLLVAVTAATDTGGTAIAAEGYKMDPSLATTDADEVILTVDNVDGLTDGDVYTVTLYVMANGKTDTSVTANVISTSTFTVTAAAESTVTAAANIADAATDIALTEATTLILPLVKTGSYVGTETLTAAITDGEDNDASGDITVTLASDDAGVIVTDNFYKDSTHIKLVVAKDGGLTADAVYTVTLTVSGVTPVTTFEVTVIADPVTATAADVASIALAENSEATATLTKVAYNAPAHSLLVAVTAMTPKDGTETTTIPANTLSAALVNGENAAATGGDDATAVKLTVGSAGLTAGDVYTVTLYVVANDVAIVPADGSEISKSTFTVTADGATATAAAASLEVSGSTDVALTKANYDIAKHDIVAKVTDVAAGNGNIPNADDLTLTVVEGTTGSTSDAKITVTATADVTLVAGDKYTVTIDVVLEDDATTVISTSDVEITIIADTTL